MEPVLRCKLRVGAVLQRLDSAGKVVAEEVELSAVGANAWAEFTPSAKFTMSITNPKAYGTLRQGSEFFVDFTPAQPAGAA